ncbi:kinase-like domain-containing protein [Cantharellus anzutake]|uniref:kinase-like domain-containing protein n=1 Tax=Cantharellus anzutake TaxID=1750568 RepID=UPI00190582E4|nr:kinase-like domain-containing protein [Cantharellus anzutake]KAF8339170.1 kinase-like domain-containing protein [Cantharellus anzutake]
MSDPSQILRGKPPYETTRDDFLIPHIAMKHVSPYEWADSNDFERVLMGCLDYEPSRRPPIHEVDGRLRQAAAGIFNLPIHADIEREFMQEDKRNLAGKIPSEQLRAPEGHPLSPYKGTYKGLVCIQQISIPDPRALSDSIRSLKRQIRLWRRLVHPNIETLYGWVLSPGTEPVVSFISAWHAHRDVVGYLHQHPATNRRRMVYNIALGLCYLHSKGIVHADIRPGNIVIGDGGNPRLRGFQFSYDRLDEPLLFDIHHDLNPRFGSPELVNGLIKIPNRASDVWAFGCVTVEILVGEPPYSCFPGVQSVIAKCFTYPSDHRISVNEVRDTFKSWLAAEWEVSYEGMVTDLPIP